MTDLIMTPASETTLHSYSPHQHVPLKAYAITLACFAAVVAATTGIRKRRGRALGITDIILLGIGTHKATRIVAKDFVTAPIRAPFTQRREVEGGGEVHDEPRKGTYREAIGDLVTCPYCLGPWVALGLATVMSLSPKRTRFALSALSAVAISDFMHQRYARLNESRKLVQAQRKQAEAVATRG